MIQDDRTARESIVDFLSDLGGSADLRPVSVYVDPVAGVPAGSSDPVAGRPARQRNLLAAFRSVPGGGVSESVGTFSSDHALPAHSPDRGASGGSLQPASGGPNRASEAAPSPGDPARRRSSFPKAVQHTSSVRADQSSDQGAAVGRVRGRVRAGAKDGRKKQAEGGADGSAKPSLPREIAKLIAKAPDSGVQVDSNNPTKLIPTEAARQDARRLFREIGERFNENRKASKTRAYAAYRHDLMANLDVLIMGGAIDLKEVTTVITNLELLTKETEAEATETPATILGRWLRMDAEEVGELERGAEAEEKEVDQEPDEPEQDDSDSSLG